jgi:hypothetical protein
MIQSFDNIRSEHAKDDSSRSKVAKTAKARKELTFFDIRVDIEDNLIRKLKRSRFNYGVHQGPKTKGYNFSMEVLSLAV